MPASLHPTKEQVRAYMHLRNCDRRPPPAPDEIRRRLGWCAGDGAADVTRAETDGLPVPLIPIPDLFLPGTIARLAALMAVEWCFVAAGLRRVC